MLAFSPMGDALSNAENGTAKKKAQSIPTFEKIALEMAKVESAFLAMVGRPSLSTDVPIGAYRNLQGHLRLLQGKSKPAYPSANSLG